MAVTPLRVLFWTQEKTGRYACDLKWRDFAEVGGWEAIENLPSQEGDKYVSADVAMSDGTVRCIYSVNKSTWADEWLKKTKEPAVYRIGDGWVDAIVSWDNTTTPYDVYYDFRNAWLSLSEVQNGLVDQGTPLVVRVSSDLIPIMTLLNEFRVPVISIIEKNWPNIEWIMRKGKAPLRIEVAEKVGFV